MVQHCVKFQLCIEQAMKYENYFVSNKNLNFHQKLKRDKINIFKWNKEIGTTARHYLLVHSIPEGGGQVELVVGAGGEVLQRFRTTPPAHSSRPATESIRAAAQIHSTETESK
jgi:hypothetical protein